VPSCRFVCSVGGAVQSRTFLAVFISFVAQYLTSFQKPYDACLMSIGCDADNYTVRVYLVCKTENIYIL
jgi:hypothetical protein